MTDPMRELIREFRLIPPGSTVLCAVSGGADSVCLLHRLWRLRRELGFQLAAAHFDHRLRGEESAQDLEFVREFVSLCCGRDRVLQADGTWTQLPPVELFTGSGDVAAQARAAGRGIEETAREMRYAFLRETARQAGAQYIATAHTANDNGETILLHLARGTGLRGLCGIAPKSGDLIRPLLTTGRGEIEDYLRFRGLPWREDPSNREDVYARNRVRHQVLPQLEGLGLGRGLLSQVLAQGHMLSLLGASSDLSLILYTLPGDTQLARNYYALRAGGEPVFLTHGTEFAVITADNTILCSADDNTRLLFSDGGDPISVEVPAAEEDNVFLTVTGVGSQTCITVCVDLASSAPSSADVYTVSPDGTLNLLAEDILYLYAY